MRTFASITFLVALTQLHAQTTALDFSADDCDGFPHHLFNDLDSGYAVVLDLVMMNCPDCAPATVAIAEEVIPNTTDPTRVKFYSIGFIDDITCAEITDWATAGGVNHPVFAGMSAQTSYYGGMGMPTIVVLGGGSVHNVYYSHLGYAPGLNPSIISFIDEALAGANGVRETSTTTVGVRPNPATDMLFIDGTNWVGAFVLDIQGREMMSVKLNDDRLDISTLRAGAYVLQLRDSTGATGTARFEKR